MDATTIVLGGGATLLTAALGIIGRRTEKAIDRVDEHETKIAVHDECLKNLDKGLGDVKAGIDRIESILLDGKGK